MSSIKIVRNDNLPEITLTLTDRQTDIPLDLSDPTTTIYVQFRAAGGTTILSTLSCAKVDALNGVVRFGFPGDTLNVPAGQYQGEIVIDYDGQILTVYDLLEFSLRADFDGD
jgi:DNA-binding beta-propeller fold protein YncE